MQNCRLFSGLSDRQIKLAKQQLDGVINSYREAEVIVEEDAIVNRIGILLQGNAYISKFTMDGKELLMQKLVPFYLVCAEVAFTRKQNAPYTIYCEKDTDIYWFSIEKITKNGLIDDGIREILLRNIMLYIADENMRKYHKIEAISIKGIRELIVHYLALQQKINGSNQFYIKFDREKLANFLGMNRSVLSHELKRMEKEGLITFKKNYFEIFRL